MRKTDTRPLTICDLVQAIVTFAGCLYGIVFLTYERAATSHAGRGRPLGTVDILFMATVSICCLLAIVAVTASYYQQSKVRQVKD